MPTLLTRLAQAAGYVPARKGLAGPGLALYGEGRAVWTPREATALARAGYARNAVVHRAVRLVAETAASLPLVPEGAGAGALAALLARPNPREGGTRLLETLYAELMLCGNAYLEAVSLDGAPRELFALRAERMRVVPGPDGWPVAYLYGRAGRTRRYEQIGAVPPILHLALFHPEDDSVGLLRGVFVHLKPAQ